MSMSEKHPTKTTDLVLKIQNILDGKDIVQSVDALALVMMSIGCSLNNISGNVTPQIIQQVNQRYYTPGQASIADALILQAYTMLSWGEYTEQLEEGEKGDD